MQANTTLFQCTWKKCRVIHKTVEEIEEHVREAHIGFVPFLIYLFVNVFVHFLYPPRQHMVAYYVVEMYPFPRIEINRAKLEASMNLPGTTYISTYLML